MAGIAKLNIDRSERENYRDAYDPISGCKLLDTLMREDNVVVY